jgi:hypothetical protein
LAAAALVVGWWSGGLLRPLYADELTRLEQHARAHQ